MHKIQTIYKRNKLYPDLLKNIYNPPKKLNFIGDLSILEKTAISVVGTREFTEYGEFVTEKIISELANYDVVIVSGLARGIDTLAHRAALKNSLPTVAVLGSGLKNIYPAENIPLARQIVRSGGSLISEFEDKAEPKNFHFPLRNRILSGLSLATLVIESREKSGALITARFALDQGREIFTVPGDLDRETSIGPLRLLQKGAAYPVTSARDIIDQLKKPPHFLADQNVADPNTTTPNTPNISKSQQPPRQDQSTQTRPPQKIALKLSNTEQTIYDALHRHTPRSIEELKEKSKLSTPEILTTLSFLEIKNLLRLKNGKYLRN